MLWFIWTDIEYVHVKRVCVEQSALYWYLSKVLLGGCLQYYSLVCTLLLCGMYCSVLYWL